MSRRFVASAVVVGLGLAIAVAAVPFLMGLLGAPLLTVLFNPLQRRLCTRMSPRWAAAIVVTVSVFAVLVPAVLVTAVMVREIPSALSGPGTRQLLDSLATLRILDVPVGPELAKASSGIVTWLSREVVGLAGSVTRIAVNLLIAYVGFYHLLLSGDQVWRGASRFVPFSRETIERLRVEFADITRAMILGVGATALVQGTIVGVAFWGVGLAHPVLWGALTGLVSVFPILGSAIVWLPGVGVLLVDHRVGAAIVLGAIGAIIASNIDNVIRPVIYRRTSGLHPVLTLVGAFMGLEYFGLLGVLVGPLALAWFFELVQAFEREYLVTSSADRYSVQT